MYITYHKEVKRPDERINTIPYEALSNELKDKIKEWDVLQNRYYFYDNGYYFFLYLDNGDRVDCSPM